jgi:hypothetical protein
LAGKIIRDEEEGLEAPLGGRSNSSSLSATNNRDMDENEESGEIKSGFDSINRVRTCLAGPSKAGAE